MKVMYKIFYPHKNNATEYYLKIIEQAILNIGEKVVYIEQFSDISREDYLIVIDVLPSIIAKIRRPKKIITWFQGIVPEEKLYFDRRNKYYIRLLYSIYNVLERYVLNHSDLNIFVSNTMQKYYNKKYGYSKSNYLVMPCFNSKLEPSAFLSEKYDKPTFLYTGNMSGWQRVPDMIALFKKIKQTMLPNAELVIFTPNQDEMRSLLTKMGVEAVVKYVHYTQLNDEIKKYKYGLLIREDMIVNNVATPTKMNTYLANGIIPVYSDVVGDFKDIFKNLKYIIPISEDFSGIEKILDIERKKLDGNEVKKDFEKVFEKYYNENYYIDIISEKLKQL